MLRLLRLLSAARKSSNGVIDGLREALKVEVTRTIGIHVEPVIEPPERSDDASVVDILIHSVVEQNFKVRDKLPSISAVFRVKNAAPFLYLSVSSFVSLCSEIIIVDNDSSDSSRLIAEQLRKDYAGTCCIKIFSYSNDVARPGEKYFDEVRMFPNRSLAVYYNFAFGQATGEFVIKADAHTMLMPFGTSEIQRQIGMGADVIYNTGVEIFGRKLDFEPRIYRRRLQFYYVDGDRWEYLTSPSGSIQEVGQSGWISKPVFLHLKAIIFARANAGGRLGSQELYGYAASKVSSLD